MKFFDNVDLVDLCLIVVVCVLLYIALSDNFEFYSASEEFGENEQHGPTGYSHEESFMDKMGAEIHNIEDDISSGLQDVGRGLESGFHGVEHGLESGAHYLEDKVDHLYHDIKGDSVPGVGDLTNYNNPEDIQYAPLGYNEQVQSSIGIPVGIMDYSSNMGLNLSDLNKPIEGDHGVEVINSSMGSLSRLPPQNIRNSKHIEEYEMDTLNNLTHDGLPHTKDDTLMDDDYNNGGLIEGTSKEPDDTETNDGLNGVDIVKKLIQNIRK